LVGSRALVVAGDVGPAGEVKLLASGGEIGLGVALCGGPVEVLEGGTGEGVGVGGQEVEGVVGEGFGEGGARGRGGGAGDFVAPGVVEVGDGGQGGGLREEAAGGVVGEIGGDAVPEDAAA
jgi:hypothetical protein